MCKTELIFLPNPLLFWSSLCHELQDHSLICLSQSVIFRPTPSIHPITKSPWSKNNCPLFPIPIIIHYLSRGNDWLSPTWLWKWSHRHYSPLHIGHIEVKETFGKCKTSRPLFQILFWLLNTLRIKVKLFEVIYKTLQELFASYISSILSPNSSSQHPA